MEKDIKIYVVTFKKYIMPTDNIYIPLHAGCENKESLGYVGDNTGDNISLKNQSYCELTGLYWMWKNIKTDYAGLTHYRRYFTNKSNSEIKNAKTTEEKLKLIYNREDIENMMQKYDIVAPSTRLIVKNVYTKYKEQHHIKDLDKCREIIKSKHPKYLETFDKTMKQKTYYICNMFIMKKELLDKYCEWLFSILFELEKTLDISEYSNMQKRVYGFLGERLFNVWINHNNELKVYSEKLLLLEHDSIKKLCNKAYKRIFKIKS